MWLEDAYQILPVSACSLRSFLSHDRPGYGFWTLLVVASRAQRLPCLQPKALGRFRFQSHRAGAELVAKLTPSPSSRSIPAYPPRSPSADHEPPLWPGSIRVRASSSPRAPPFPPPGPPPQVPNQPSRSPPPQPPPPPPVPSRQSRSRVDDARAHPRFCFGRSRSRRRHAAGGLGAGGAAPGRGEAVGAGDEPRGGGRVGQGAGDRAEAGGDARHAARPPRGRVRALPHRPRRQDRRGRGQQRLCGALALADREEGGEPEPLGSGRAVRVRRASRAAAAAAGGEGDGEAGLREAARGRRERERQPPQQQRRRAAQLLHAPLLHPQLHRAAPRPHPLLLQLRPGRERHRPRRLQQEGERRRHGQVLAAAVGPAVAQVEPAAARPRRNVRRAVGDADCGGPLCSRGQSLKYLYLSC